ncbi:MAG: hypothetical protein K2J32_11105 [Ruminococcus sp.]|nr:hypothetical protein [Ruminococcus sp.]
MKERIVIMKNELIQQLENKFNESADIFNFSTINAVPHRVIIFITIGSSRLSSEYAESIIEYSRKIMKDGSVTCIVFEDNKDNDSLRNNISMVIKRASEKKAVANANELFVMPLFFQDTSNVNVLDDISEKFYCQYNEEENRLKEMGYNIFLIPTAVMFSEYMYVCSDKVKSTMIFKDHDSKGYVIKKESLVKTFVLSAMMLSESKNSMIKSNNGAHFSAGILALSMPVHITFLRNIQKLLCKFTDIPSDHEERMTKFGNIISSKIKNILWCGFNEKLSIDDSKRISISPIYSFNNEGGKEETEKFINEYYLSHIPVNEELVRRNMGSLIEMFCLSYKECYGCGTAGIDEIFSDGKVSDFIEKYITDLEVSIPTSIPEGIKYEIITEAKKLAATISNRIKEVYFVIMNDSKEFISDAKSRHKKFREFIEDFQVVVSDEISKWKGIETEFENISIAGVSDDFEVTDEMLRVLIDFYIKVLKGETDNIDGKEFIEKVWKIARRNFNKSKKQYLQELENICINDEKKLEIVESCMEKVQSVLPMNVLPVGAEWHFSYNSPESALFTALAKRHGELSSEIHIFEKMDDRIEILCFATVKI